GCVDYMTDNANCGGCHAGCSAGAMCVGGNCTGGEGGASDGGGIPCPDAGCPMSAATGFSCPFGACNGTSSECTSPSGCYCASDSDCLSGKCVKVKGEN